ncbi:unnamed protein product [Rotaria sp. Silwood2]|nr:unnamed protein product [Rotaria sp. Silwood2]CAF4183632.1 unnamed protein product [Rotaria sp. Silwood2]
MFDHSDEIRPGKTLLIYIHNVCIICQLAEFLDKVDCLMGDIIEVFPKSLESGDVASIKFIPSKPICVEKFDDYPSLGCFVIRDMNRTLAVGIIQHVDTITTAISNIRMDLTAHDRKKQAKTYLGK